VKDNADYRDIRDGEWDNKTVKPIINCVAREPTGEFYAWFGYDNYNSHNVYVAVGPDNRFTPSDFVVRPGGQSGFVQKANGKGPGKGSPLDENLGQPTKFVPGKYDRVFKVR